MKRGRPIGTARPGVKLTPLTKLELATLQALADDLEPEALAVNGYSLRAVWARMHRMRLKLGAFRTPGMVAIGIRRGLIK